MKLDRENYYDIKVLKQQFSHSSNENWLKDLDTYTYSTVKAFFKGLSIKLGSKRNDGVKNTSLDFEMLALGMVAELYHWKRGYKSNDENLSPRLKHLDYVSKKIFLKAQEFDVKNAQDVIDYPHLEELLDAFMMADSELASHLVGFEMEEV